jgi:hypothetical protein
VPFDFSADGTRAATAELALLVAGAAVDAVLDALELADELLLLLLPQAASATTHISANAPSSGFLQVSI